jgi:hypothetical protein
MPIQKRFPVSRTSITAVVLLLCAVGFAYSQGWFNLSRPSAEIESEKVSTDQTFESRNSTEGTVQPTPQATEPVAEPKE